MSLTSLDSTEKWDLQYLTFWDWLTALSIVSPGFPHAAGVTFRCVCVRACVTFSSSMYQSMDIQSFCGLAVVNSAAGTRECTLSIQDPDFNSSGCDRS